MSFIVNTVLATLVAVILLVIGIGQYGSLRFAAVTHPLSGSYVAQLMDVKTAHAREITTPKIVTVSGSSGLYGLRCEVFTRELAAPCVNGGLPIELSFPTILDFDQRLMRSGDVVLMPIEYAMYLEPRLAGPDQQSGLFAGVRRVQLPELFRIDLRYLLLTVSENLLASTGYTFFGRGNIVTHDGDRRGHTRETAAFYADQRAKETFGLALAYPQGVPNGAMQRQLSAFFSWAKGQHILVIGTVQPEYDDWEIPPSWLKTIPRLFTHAGLPFVILPNASRYPRRCFWDASDHLVEECQFEHTRRLAEAIKPILAERGYAFPRSTGR